MREHEKMKCAKDEDRLEREGERERWQTFTLLLGGETQKACQIEVLKVPKARTRA